MRQRGRVCLRTGCWTVAEGGMFEPHALVLDCREYEGAMRSESSEEGFVLVDGM